MKVVDSIPQRIETVLDTKGGQLSIRYKLCRFLF